MTHNFSRARLVLVLISASFFSVPALAQDSSPAPAPPAADVTQPMRVAPTI
jgi:hypothetical protein